MRKILTFCKPYLWRYKNILIIFYALSLISSITAYITPYITGGFIDGLVGDAETGFLFRFAGIFVGLGIFSLLTGYINGLLSTKAQTGASYDLNKATIRHLHNVPISFFSGRDTANLTQRISADANALISFAMNQIFSIAYNFLNLLIPTVILLSFNRLVTVLILALICVYVLCYYVFKRMIYAINLELKEGQSEFFSKAYMQLSNIRFVKNHVLSEVFIKKLDESFNRLMRIVIKNQKVGYVYSGLDNIIMLIAQLAVFIVGGIQVINGVLTVGQFTIIAGYFRMMMNGVRFFFGLAKNIQEHMVSFNRLDELLQLPRDNVGTEKIESINMIKISNLAFGFPENTIFNCFNYTFEENKIYAITGENGSGKSTLIDLIIGHYIQEYQGEVSINQTDICNIDINSYRTQRLSISEQTPYLLNDALSFNMDLSERNIDTRAEPYKQLVSMLNMESLLETHGLDYCINERTDNLSGGEKQKIALFRCLYKPHSLLVLDEPGSALDYATKNQLIEYLKNNKHGRITLIVTHDSEFVEICDEEIKLNGLSL